MDTWLQTWLLLPEDLQGYSSGEVPQDTTTLVEGDEGDEVTELSQEIVLDLSSISDFGEAPQRELGVLVDEVLKKTTAYDTGALSNLLLKMNDMIKQYNDKVAESRVDSLLRTPEYKVMVLRMQYEGIVAQLEEIASQLDQHRLNLLADTKVIDEVCQRGLACYRELSLYSEACQRRLNAEKTNKLDGLSLRAELSQLEEDVFAQRDFAGICTSLEGRLDSLKTSSTICFQLLCQLKLVQETDTKLAQGIQNSILNTIPIWKQGMITAFAAEYSQVAAELDSQSVDIDKMLTSNAELLLAIQGMMDVQKAVLQAKNDAMSEFGRYTTS